jgi:hypothetical protein
MVVNKWVSLAAMAAVITASSTAWAQATTPAPKAAPAATTAPAGNSDDKYIGYYYPKTTSYESFSSQMKVVDGVDRQQRIQFVTVVSTGTLQAAYRVPYAVFAKGDKAEHLIIVGLRSGELDTIYRIRALLANMTTMARTSPFFQEHTVAEDATFFDLLKLLGFTDVTVTDGEVLSHQVKIN